MEYKYTNRKVVKLTNNIIKVIEEIAQRDDTLFEDAHVGIDMADYSVQYVDGDDVIIDDINDGGKFIDLDLYHIYSMDWIRYNSKLNKYLIMRQKSASSPKITIMATLKFSVNHAA
jgi:hydroxypyruvate isomerase